VDDPDQAPLADALTQVTTPDETGGAELAGYPIRSIVIVGVVLLVLFGVFVFATFR
jgi:TRAP-type mannitol/chloroaromatic compound transport system permease small subunit